MSESIVRTRRWSRLEYETMIEKGVFRPDERLELLGGELVVREPHGGPHAFAIERTSEALLTAFGLTWRIRVQLPIALDEDSEPEPDVSVVAGPLEGAPRELPSQAVLVVEVADSTLAGDREYKSSLYARARVPDYWIVNLVDRVLEVYRDPRPDASASYGWAYRSVQSLSAGEHVSPLAAPTARVPVADLLP
jgi:Uma2 family endonuclease